MEKELHRPTASVLEVSAGRRFRRPGWSLVAAVALCLMTAQAPLTAAEMQVLYGDDGAALAWDDGRQVMLPSAKGSRFSRPNRLGTQWWVSANEPHSEGQRIVLTEGQGTEIVEQSVVHIAPGKTLFASQPVVDDTGLQAVMWLEGTEVRTSEVRYALRRGNAWSEPQTLSPRGAGTQTALTVASLDDGSWLALWTAFDGNDSEVLWSRFQEGSWSTPATLDVDNRVPDITPQVLAVDGGALAAWSRYDGQDYRLMVARFDTTKSRTTDSNNTDSKTTVGPWSAPQRLGAPGTVYPQWTAAAQPLLAFRQAVPAGWTLLKLDLDGKALAQTHTPSRQQEAPILRPLDDSKIELRWLQLNNKTTKVAEPIQTVLTWQPLD